MSKQSFEKIEELCLSNKVDYSLVSEYNSIIFVKYKITEVIDAFRKYSTNNEVDELFLFNVFEGMTCEHSTKKQKISSLLAAAFIVIGQINNYIYIYKSDLEKIMKNVTVFLNEQESLIKDGNDKINTEVQFILRHLDHSSRKGRNTSSYTDDEVGLRVIRDSLRLFILAEKSLVKSKLDEIIEVNTYRRVPNSFNNVVENESIFLEKFQKDLIITPWATQWSKRKTFMLNYIQHCKDKIKFKQSIFTEYA